MSGIQIVTYRGPAMVPFEVSIGNYQHDFAPVVNHPATQRTKGIGQLSPVHLVLPGAARHTRYEHLMGVFGQSLDLDHRQSRRHDGPRIRMSPYETLIRHLVSMLHDHGHGPFSHVYEIVAEHYGFPGHKRRCYEDVMPKMEKEIMLAAGEQFARNHVVEDLVAEMKDKGPIYRLVCGRMGLDKLDYIVRDCYHCGVGDPPNREVSMLLDNLDFDFEGEGSQRKKVAIHLDAIEPVESLLGALTNNNTRIYINDSVEIGEALLIRAITAAMDDGFDFMAGYDFTDRELEDALGKYPRSGELLKTLYEVDFNSKNPFVQAVVIKPEGYAWADAPKVMRIEEAKDSDIDELVGRLRLPKVRALEKEIHEKLGLRESELFITFSPQINRLQVPENEAVIYFTDKRTGKKQYRNLFDITPGLHELQVSRTKRHYGIRLITTENKIGSVGEFLDGRSFLEILRATINSSH